MSTPRPTKQPRTPRVKKEKKTAGVPHAPRATAAAMAPAFRGAGQPAKTLRLARAPRAPAARAAGAPGERGIDMALRKNANLYVAALIDPFRYGTGLRVPDLLSWPTATTTFRSVISAVGLSTSQNVQLYFQPSLVANGADPSAAFLGSRTAVAGVYPAWSLADDTANLATAVASFAFVRTVAFGVRAVNTTALTNRGGSISVTRVYDPDDVSTTATALGSNPNVWLVSANSDDASQMELSWRPENYSTGLAFNRPSTGFTAPKGAILFEFGPSASVNTYSFEVVHHVEFIPKITQAQLFDVASAPGDESGVSRATMEVEQLAGDPSGSVNGQWNSRLVQAAHVLIGGFAIMQELQRGGAAVGGAGAAVAAAVGRATIDEDTRATAAAARAAASGAPAPNPIPPAPSAGGGDPRPSNSQVRLAAEQLLAAAAARTPKRRPTGASDEEGVVV